MMTLEEWVHRAQQAASDAERWAIIRDAWVTYRRHGAGVFDWDYDSRDVMRAMTEGDVA